MIKTHIKNYAHLMRLHKPIGILLLLWPTLWALWLAGDGHPNLFIVTIFILGVIVMRSAGCIINDVADRHVDRHVERTRDRPLASGIMSMKEALILFVILMALALLLVCALNRLTILLAMVGAVIAVIYPFLKRVTYLPQIGLGAAFSWGVPMAFAAEINQVPFNAWVLFFAAAIWPVIYDTYYAMVDRADDIKINVKSTAILFGRYDLLLIGFLQIIFLITMGMVGYLFNLRGIYFISLLLAAVFFVYQQWTTRDRNKQACFNAFLNHWVGLIIFAGIVIQ